MLFSWAKERFYSILMERQEELTPPKPRLSVTIATCNRSEELCRCVLSLASLAPLDFVVLVLDDGSQQPVEPFLSPRALDHRPRGRPARRWLALASLRGVGYEICMTLAIASRVCFTDERVVAYLEPTREKAQCARILIRSLFLMPKKQSRAEEASKCGKDYSSL